MLAKGQTVIQLFEQFAPKSLAVPDDKIGLQLGTLQKEIRKILVALDVDMEVVEEAVREQADLIIAHHAIIFRPLAHLQTDTPAGKIYEKLIKHDIAVYIAHTNLDAADGGINDMMARVLGLTDVGLLEEGSTEKLFKLVVFVPVTHREIVREALFRGEAGHIGGYSHCSFQTEGLGTFMPLEGTNPYIGTRGNMEQTEEVRLETVVPESSLKLAIRQMLKAHPYEEVAYDIYPLQQKGKSSGLGRVGKLPAALPLKELAEQVKEAFQVPFVRVCGDLNRSVRKAAVLGGSGGRYVRHAIFAGADVLITGDIDYHTAQDAVAAGLCLIDPGHNAEKIMKEGVARIMSRKLAEAGYATEIVPSAINTEPFQFI